VVTIDEPTGTHFIPTYRSGTAARLAGIPVETLRVWERRYGVVGPGLSPRGHRLYATEDVSRLALIKQLVDLGNPIGSIATLPLASLRQMRDAADAALHVARVGPEGWPQALRVALVGEALAELGRAAGRAEVGVHDDDVHAALGQLDEPALVAFHRRLGLDDMVVYVCQTHLDHSQTPGERAPR